MPSAPRITMKKCLYDKIIEVDHYEESIKSLKALTMARVKIKDLPEDKKISKAEMKKVTGGYAVFQPTRRVGSIPGPLPYSYLPGPIPYQDIPGPLP